MQDLNPAMRRRKLIGWRSPGKDLWPGLVHVQLGTTVDEFADDVAAALAWLCDANSRITNTSWDLWDLRETQNGAIYLMPVEQGPWRMKRSDRYFDETLTREGGGICASMLAISWIGRARSGDLPFCLDERIPRLLKRLNAFRELHPEGFRINRVLN